jgi:uncharacterized protein YbjT (DUF2867 family)
MFAVTGITGQVGGAAARTLLELTSDEVDHEITGALTRSRR